MAITIIEESRAAFEEALRVDDPQALYEQAPCGYLTLGPTGLVLKANQTFLTWTGYAAGDLVGKAWVTDILTVGSRIYFETHVRPMLHVEKQVRELALDLKRADATTLPVLLNAVMEHDEHGALRLVRLALFEATERRRYEQELLAQMRRAEESEQRLAVVARTLQETLMPPRPPHIPGLDLATSYRPAGQGNEIGGDFYDVFEVGEGAWMVNIGDVAGKGVEAAVVATLARHTLRALAVTEQSPARMMDHLNQVLLGHPTERFLTAAVLRMERSSTNWQVTMALGGHPPALLVPPAGSGPPTTIGHGAHLVGAFDFADYHDEQLDLRPGSTLFLYTDGVTEGSSPAQRGLFYGEDRLSSVLEGQCSSAQSLVDRVLADVLAFQHGHARDDIAIVAMRVPD